MSGREVVGEDLKRSLSRESDTINRVFRHEVSSQSPWVFSADENSVWVLVEQVADCVKIAESKESSIVKNDNLLSDALDLIKDVAGDEHGLTLRPKVANYAHDAGASDWVASMEWLVEDNQVRVVDKGVCDLNSLPHALAVLANLLVLNIR